MIHVRVLYQVCAIKGTTIKFCMSGSQHYIVLPTVGYPTCSDKWRPDKWHPTVIEKVTGVTGMQGKACVHQWHLRSTWRQALSLLHLQVRGPKLDRTDVRQIRILAIVCGLKRGGGGIWSRIRRAVESCENISWPKYQGNIQIFRPAAALATRLMQWDYGLKERPWFSQVHVR